MKTRGRKVVGLVKKKSQKECPPFATTTAGYTVAGIGSPCFLDYTVAGLAHFVWLHQ